MKISNNDPRIDIAINSYPMVDLPDGFTAKVMNTIRKEHPRFRFRLQFIDLALPMFLSLFSLTLLGVCAWGMNQLEPLWLEYLKLEITYSLRGLMLAIGFEDNFIILFSMMILLVGSLAVVWLINRPQKILRI